MVFVAIAIPVLFIAICFLALLMWFRSQDIKCLEKRTDSLETRLNEKIVTRYDWTNAEIERAEKRLASQFESGEQRLASRIERLEARLHELRSTVGR